MLLGDSWKYMPHILVPSRGFVCDIKSSSKELPIQSKLLKHKNKVWKLLRIKNEDNVIVLGSLLLPVNIFQTCSSCWLWTGKRFLVHIEKISTFKDKIKYMMRYVVVY